MRILIVASYELGHQPLGVAAPASLLRSRGHEVRTLDLSMEQWDRELVEWADRIAFSVPMHTASRIARRAIAAARSQRPDLPIACFGLYALTMGDVADSVIAGETDQALAAWIDGGDARSVVDLGRHAAVPGRPLPARDLLPSLDRYARLAVDGQERVVGYVEASHGCSHRCRHCPVPVVYDGRLRIVDVEAVLDDAAQQVAAGATHITFGDPDFLNGAQHARRVVRAFHDRFPGVSFDCTVKVEHILRHEDIWSEFADAGCLFVVSAFESTDDETLARLDKGHTAADAARAVTVLREHGIEIRPSWMPFTPWTTLDQVQTLLDFVAEHDLVGNVDPVQYTIRLLLPEGSLLLTHPEVLPVLGPYDAERGAFMWASPEPAMDDLQLRLSALVEDQSSAGADIPMIYAAIREVCGLPPVAVDARASEMRPRLTEPWFCCAEPTSAQLDPFAAVGSASGGQSAT
jgi:radical SAM superfamily enzyme YgiQ (UPF0313 family)